MQDGQNARAVTPFPDRMNQAVAAELAKHPGQYLRGKKMDKWQEAATGNSLSASTTPPPANIGACGSIIWEWNGADYDEVSRNCNPGCTCKPVQPDVILTPMPIGAQFTKDC